MISEFAFLFKYLGLKGTLANKKAVVQARGPLRGYVTTTCFFALVETGFMEELSSHTNVDGKTFCATKKLDPILFESICLYLGRTGYLNVQGPTVSFTAQGRKFWDAANGVMNIFCAYEPFFKNLPALLKGDVTRQDLKRRDDYVAAGFRQTGRKFTFEIMNNLIKATGAKFVVELGCGNIDLSLHVAGRQPDLKFLGFDWDDHYLEEARQTIAANQLSNRVTVLKQDLFKLTAKDHDFSGYDVISAIDLFHGYFYDGKEKLLELFAALKKTFAGKTFVISEVCLPDEEKMKNLSYPHVEHELFHTLTFQKTFKEGELQSLLAEAGFRNIRDWSIRNLGARIFVQFEA